MDWRLLRGVALRLRDVRRTIGVRPVDVDGPTVDDGPGSENRTLLLDVDFLGVREVDDASWVIMQLLSFG